MTPRHHPDDALLLAHAASSQDVAMVLVVATHLSFCAPCRAHVAHLEQLGGILLEDSVPEPLAADALTKILARLDTPAPAIAPMPLSKDGTPPPLRAFLGRDLSDTRWRRMGPRLAFATLQRNGSQTLRLLRGAPGADVGRHTHRGMEYTLVLRGGFTDETGTYGPGDLQIASADLKHNPVADPDEDCINLALTTAPLRFDGLVQKIVGRLFGF